jgi:hypothetical protein
MSDGFDPLSARALDRFTVPALPADFADRLVTRALATSALPPLPSPAPRRNARSGWRRSGVILAGVAGLGLMSAAAAATGVFGDAVRVSVRSAPVIRTIIASVTPERPKVVAKPKPATLAKPVVAPATVEAAVVAETLPVMIAPAVSPRRELRREVIAQRIAERIERRTERRAELGLPPRPIRPLAVAPRLRDLPPQDRAVIIDRVRELRAAAQYSNRPTRLDMSQDPGEVGPLPLPATGANTPERAPQPKIDARPEGLRSPERIEQRRALQQLREMRQRRRELRRQRQQ